MDKKQMILDSIPVRKYRGENVPFVRFNPIIIMLNKYKFSDKELDLLQAEVDELKRNPNSK